jgi:transposase InsO family protein
MSFSYSTGQNWKTFLKNYSTEIISIDFLTVPTVNFKLLNESHLRSILKDYFSYYNKYRTHLGINKDSPEGRPTQSDGVIYKVPAVNGLHHVYFRKVA